MSSYEKHADAYARHTAVSLHNARYERPALYELLPARLDGAHVLDAGCGPGENIPELLSRGALVTAVDVSEAMMARVRERFGDRVAAAQADLSQPLAMLTDASFDLIVSSLALHYVRDWDALMREFARILRPGGEIIFSTHHPELRRADARYFETELVEDAFLIDGAPMPVRYWRRSLQAMVEPMLAAGFTLARIVEPPLDGKPWFILFAARRV